MFFRPFPLSLAAFLTCFSFAYAQGDKEFVRLGVEDGLSQSWVRKAVQDSYGFMWFGTKDGLNRYDGQEFRVYRPESENERGLESGSINALYLDAFSRLWVCTLGGAFLYDRERDRFELFEPIGRTTVSAVLQASDGSFWFGTPDELFHYSPGTDELKRYVHDPSDATSLVSNIVWNLLEDRRGRLWIGTQEGLCLYQRSSDSFLRLKDEEGVGRSWVQSLLEDSWGRIWVGTEHSIYLYELGDGGRLDIEMLMPLRGQCLAADQDGDIWLGHGSAQGLTYWELDDESGDLLEPERYFNRLHDEKSLSADGVDCIYVDAEGAVWIGTYGDGLNYYSPAKKNFYSVEIHDVSPGIEVGEQVNAILVDDNNHWIGTEGGLIRYDVASGEYTEYKADRNVEGSLAGNAVYQIFKDSRGEVWFGKWGGGMSRYVPETDSFVRYFHDPEDPSSLSNNNVFSIEEDTSGNLWVGTIGGGLNLFDRESETFRRFTHDPQDERSINSQYINDIVQDSDGVLWISTYSSLDRYDPETGYFEHFSHTGDPLPQNRGDLELIFIDSRDQMWLGTEVGLVFFDREKGGYKRYGVPHGLPNNSIKSINEDASGSLWITTNYGLSEFVNGIQVPDNPQFINYDRKDGLQSNEFVKRSSFVSENGEIWIGGVSGLTRFRPEEIEPSTELPKVLITDLRILNKKVYPGDDGSVLVREPYLLDHLELDYESSVFAFQFSSIVYPRNDDVEYAYMLDGFDEKWQYVRGSTMAVYTNIDPGTYTFRVKSSNTDGIWGDNAESLIISITPPLWMSFGFRALVLILIGLALFAAYRVRVIALKRSRLALAKSVADRTRELAVAKEALSAQNEELKVHRTRLEDLVNARTRELKAARDKAEVSDKLKSAFIGNMSHEIRTPLNAIMGFSQLIAMEAKGRGEFDDYSNCIRENTEMLVQLLNDIIDFSIFESEKLTLNYECIDAWMFFHELSAEVSQLVGSRAPAGVRYEADNRLQDDLSIRFDADKVRLRQILLNLATNACKFTEVGSVSFGMSFDSEKKTLNYWIKDTGVGIAPAEHEAVFERFHKIVDTKKSFARGTGLGLAICRRLADELGFQIGLESELGKGSVFTLTIPIVEAPKSSTRRQLEESEDKSTGLNLAGRCILVAEDIVNNYTIVERFLAATGARLIHALDGAQAVDIFKQRGSEIDLLLLDIAMPNMGGVEALRAIRELAPEIPAIALTAHAFKDDVQSLLDSGFQRCLTKPVEQKDLLREIARTLDRLKPSTSEGGSRLD